MRNNLSISFRHVGSTSAIVFFVVLICTTAVPGDALRTHKKSTTKIPMPGAAMTRNTNAGGSEKLAMVVDVIPALAMVVEIPPAAEKTPTNVVRTPTVGESPKSSWSDNRDTVKPPFTAKSSLDPVQPSLFLDAVESPDGKPSLKPLKPVRSTRPSTEIAFVTPPVNMKTRAANYQYNTDFNIALDVSTCQSSMINSGCPEECNGVSINGECACPACGIGSAIDSSRSLAKTVVSARTKTTLSTTAFILDIDANVFPTGPGEVQVDVYKHRVSFGAAKNQVQISDVLILRPTAVNGFITITMKYDTSAIYPGWVPRVLKMNPITWLWEDASRHYTRGDGAIYFEVDKFEGQFVVVSSSATGARLNPRAFYGRICECNGGREVSMPCSFNSDAVCAAPRAHAIGPMQQVTVVVNFPSLDLKSLDEYHYRVALARLVGVDFRDVVVSSVTLLGDDASSAVPVVEASSVLPAVEASLYVPDLTVPVVEISKNPLDATTTTTTPLDGNVISVTETTPRDVPFTAEVEITKVGSIPIIPGNSVPGLGDEVVSDSDHSDDTTVDVVNKGPAVPTTIFV